MKRDRIEDKTRRYPLPDLRSDMIKLLKLRRSKKQYIPLQTEKRSRVNSSKESIKRIQHKLIRKYQVTGADVHDSQVFEELSSANTSRDLWADSACRSAERLLWLDSRVTGNMCSARGHVIIPCHPGSSGASVRVLESAAGWSISLAYRHSEPAVCSCLALAW